MIEFICALGETWGTIIGAMIFYILLKQIVPKFTFTLNYKSATFLIIIYIVQIIIILWMTNSLWNHICSGGI